MMLPLSAPSQISALGNGQVPTSVLPGQAEPDLTDEQKAGYDMELAALLLQLQPLVSGETPLPTAGVADKDITTQQTMQPEQVALLSVPLQHFSQQAGEYQLSQSLSSADVMVRAAEVAALMPTQSMPVSTSASTTASATSIDMMQNMFNVAAPTPTATSLLQPSLVHPVPLAATAPLLTPVNDNPTLWQTQHVVPTAAATAAFTALETAPQQAITTLLEQAKMQLPAQAIKADFNQSQPLPGFMQQQSQQALLHSTPVSQAMLVAQLLNPQSGGESSQSSLPSGISATQAPAQQVNYQWQSEPMPADPARFGQRLLALLSDKVDIQLGLGVNKAMIRLDPPSLGSIELAVQLDGEKLTVHLNSSNAQLKEAMQQGLEQLRASLQLRLGSDAQIELRMGPDAQSQQQREQQAQAQDEIAANIAGVEQTEDVDTTQSSTAGLVNQLV